MIEAQQRESSAANAAVFGIIGMIAGGIISYVLLHEFGAELPRLVRFVLLIAGAGGTAWLLARLANIIVVVIGLAFWGAIVLMIGSLIWKFI
ncbi:hypothetical protein DPH57_10895 [Massilia sp. YMA4]|nr:hypothetical protein DPH57_10895 [Massilia sp. YMA4]